MRFLVLVGISIVLAASVPAACGEAGVPQDRGATDEPAAGETVACSDPQPPFVTDLRVRQEQPVAEPAPRAAFRDAIYGGCVVRVSDRGADPDADDPSLGIKNEYARLQSFNANGTRIMLMSLEVYRYLYDADTLERLDALPSMNDPRWSNVEPNTIYYIGELTLMAFDVATGEHHLVHDFAPAFVGEDVVMVWTRWEGNPSADDRFWALMAEDSDWMTTAFLVYDLLEDRIAARRPVSPPGDVDNVTMSPLGSYVLAQFEYCEHGTMGSGEHPCGLMVYDRDLGNPRGLLRNVGHADVALDADGREVLLYQDLDTDHVAVLDLQDGTITNLHPIDFSYCDGCGMHFSGIAHALPGWGLVSYFDADPITRMWMDDHVFAVEMKAGGRVVRFAQHHALVDPEQEHDYWAEPHASVNRDFTRVLFTSNWGRSGSGEVDTYMIVLPDGWTEEVP